MTDLLPPRCQRQIGTGARPPHRLILCPRSADPGTNFCSIHHEDTGATSALLALDHHTAQLIQTRKARP